MKRIGLWCVAASILMLGGCAQHSGGPAPSGVLVLNGPYSASADMMIVPPHIVEGMAAPVVATHVMALRPGKSETPGFAVYTYLVDTGDNTDRSAAAACAFIGSSMSPSGDPSKDPTAATAAYYLFQRQATVPLEAASLTALLQNYDLDRARAFAARLGGLPPGLYLASYIQTPLPFEGVLDAKQLDVVALSSLSPDNTFKYVRAYQGQLARGGTDWKKRTVRQYGIDVAHDLALIAEAKGLFSTLLSSEANAAEVEKFLADDKPPAIDCEKLLSRESPRSKS
jgi:hypothetical protein